MKNIHSFKKKYHGKVHPSHCCINIKCVWENIVSEAVSVRRKPLKFPVGTIESKGLWLLNSVSALENKGHGIQLHPKPSLTYSPVLALPKWNRISTWS